MSQIMMSKIQQEKYKIKLRKQREMLKFKNSRVMLAEHGILGAKSPFNQQLLGHHSADLAVITSQMSKQSRYKEKMSKVQRKFHSYSAFMGNVDSQEKIMPATMSLYRSYHKQHSKKQQQRSVSHSHHFISSHSHWSKPSKSKIQNQNKGQPAITKKQTKEEIQNLNISKNLSSNLSNGERRKIKQFKKERNKKMMEQKSYLFNLTHSPSKIIIKEGVKQLSRDLLRDQFTKNKDENACKYLIQIREKIDKELLSRFRKIEY